MSDIVYNIFDSHAHYDDKAFDADQDEVIKKIKKAGVNAVCNIGADLKSSYSTVELAKKHDFFYASVGFHPHSAKEWRPEHYDEIKALAKEEKVVAIGEIGLDYHYDYSPRDVQQSVFREQLRLANDCDLPVVIHMREATADTISILKEYNPRGIIHCYSGSAETAKILLDMGFYIGFTGVITFPNARKVLDAVRVVPMDRLLIETDCPFMAPVPFRGQRCDSSMLSEVVKTLAMIKGFSMNDIMEKTMTNAKTVYGISF